MDAFQMSHGLRPF